jgi:phospholipase C
MTKSQNESGWSRRRFLKQTGMAAVASSLPALPGCGNSSGTPGADTAVPRALPDPKDSGIDHVVVVMMENRSFDHMLGWVPGADGIQAQRFVDSNGETHDTHRLTPDFQGCGLDDPAHGYGAGRVHFNDGKMDGFLFEAAPGDRFPIGYYTAEDLAFYAGCAQHWTICDRYHTGILASTQANRMYMHAGQTDRRSNIEGPIPGIPATTTLRSIWDVAQEAGVSVGYFFSNLPYTALWEARHLAISKPIATFDLIAAAGLLPNITYIDPFFYQSGLDLLCNDDHPHADVRNGQLFLNHIYNVLRSSPSWERTLLVINYDEWGGFFDHVAPPVMPVSDHERDVIENDGRLGFRVPCVLIGPRAKRGHVEHTLFEPNSILKFMEWRWNLEPLGVRAAVTNNLAYALDFDSAPKLNAPGFAVPYGLFGDTLCNIAKADTSKSMAEHFREVEGLRLKARLAGFPV